MQRNGSPVGQGSPKWLVRHVRGATAFIRVTFGIVWLVDGSFKFAPGFVDSFPDLINRASSGQPSWLQPWFSFWSSVTSTNAAPFVYTTGFFEIALGLALVLGFFRKIAYIGGIVISLMIWSIPEGFGGAYGPGSTDIGTGVIYSFVFLSLIIINATYGPSKYSLDLLLERRFPSWKRLAEFG